MTRTLEPVVVDATDARLGRMAARVAKSALEGSKVVIINCEEAVITGTKRDILTHYKALREIGRSTKGPFFPRMPDRFVRRIVRGMLPYKTPHGKAAFQRIQCYIGSPEQYKNKGVSMENKPATRRMKVGELCTLLGGRTK